MVFETRAAERKNKKAQFSLAPPTPEELAQTAEEDGALTDVGLLMQPERQATSRQMHRRNSDDKRR